MAKSAGKEDPELYAQTGSTVGAVAEAACDLLVDGAQGLRTGVSSPVARQPGTEEPKSAGHGNSVASRREAIPANDRRNARQGVGRLSQSP